MNENIKINKVLLSGWGVIDAILLIAYMLEFIKGERSIGYFIVFILCGGIPYVIGQVVYRKNKESNLVKYITAYGYAIFYTFVLLTGDTTLVFTYILPILSLLLLCNDVKLLIGLSSVSLASNVISVVYHIVIDKMTSADDIADYEIQIAATLLCMGLAIVATKVSYEINQYKISKIKEKENKQEEMLKAIKEFVDGLNVHAVEITNSMEKITESASVTTISIEEISGSSTQTAESIQEQLLRTSEIQQHIEHATALATDIKSLTENTSNTVQAGISHVKELNDGTLITKQNSEIVEEKTENLKESTSKAMDIISIIHGIANQTNLLALNASIEAAHAGDAGRGFAVVASEITSLANQTKDATENIRNLIEKLNEEVFSVAEAIEEMSIANEKQNKAIEEVSKNFNDIENTIETVSDRANLQESKMIEIHSANVSIVESINTISAISEEVTAGCQQTLSTTEKNKEVTEEVNNAVLNLKTEVDELSKLHE